MLHGVLCFLLTAMANAGVVSGSGGDPSNKVSKSGDVISGELVIDGYNQRLTNGGIKFPDGSLQTSAALPIGATLSFVDDFSLYVSTNFCYPDLHSFGPWQSAFNGFGCNKVLNGGSTTYLVTESSPSFSVSETHAALVLGPKFLIPVDISAKVKNTKQLRTPTPNPFEMGWLLWNYRDNTHFYYLALKTNGWELGKEDPAYGGNQRFMVTGTSPTFVVGSTYTMRVTQDSNNLISVYANSNLLATYIDTERPYQFGNIGLYEEDARVEWSNIIVNSTTTASAPYVPVPDFFGSLPIYPTIAGGKEWHSTWGNGHAHGISGVTTPSRDPDDQWFDAAHGNANFYSDGGGILSVSSGTDVNNVTTRMYVHDPQCPYSGTSSCPAGTQQWRDVESTIYFDLLHGGDAFEGGSIALRTKHGPDTDLCDTRGYHLRVRTDGNVDVFKETAHPAGIVGNQIDNPGYVGALPTATWIGVKSIAYDLPDGNVKLEIWQDLTDGANGGTWTKIWEFTDNGANLGGGTACSGQSTFAKLTSSSTRAGSESGYGNLSVYARHTVTDGVASAGIQYKKWTIREITPTIPASGNIGGGSNQTIFTSTVVFKSLATFGTAPYISTFSASGRLTIPGASPTGFSILVSSQNGNSMFDVTGAGLIHTSSGIFVGVSLSSQPSAGAGAATTALCPSGSFAMGGSCDCSGGVALTGNVDRPNCITPGCIPTGHVCQEPGGTGGACIAYVTCTRLQ